MAVKKHPTSYPGIRYHEHESRKAGRILDRYYYIRYRPTKGGKQVEEGVGWHSNGWTPVRIFDEIISVLKQNKTLGTGPVTLDELREEAYRNKQAKRLEKQKREFAFEDVADHFLIWAEANKRSWKDDEQRLRMHILPELGQLVMKNITTTTIEQLKATLINKKPERGNGATLAPATVHQCLALVRSIFNYAIHTTIPGTTNMMMHEGRNPARMTTRFDAGIRPLKFDNRRLRVLTNQELDALFDALACLSCDVHDVSLLALDCGLRRSEATSLTWEMINLESGSIRIVDPKDGESRTVYPGTLIPSVISMLRRRLFHSFSHFVFPGKNGGKRDANSVTRTFGKSAEICGINWRIQDTRMKVTFHTLRHTHATRMLEKGVDIYTLKELLGHSDISVTERYLHLCDHIKRERALKGGGIYLG